MDERKFIDVIINTLSQGQCSLALEIRASLEEGMDSRLEAYFLTSTLMGSPEKVNWPIFFQGIEHLIDESADGIQREIVYQEILETLANRISNGGLAHTWITSNIGPLARNYIEEYDSFMGGKTPGF